MKTLFKVAFAAICLTAIVHACTLSEGFDNIATLPGSGWALTNNSSPAGTTSWFQGNSGVFSSQGGAADSYIAANFNNAGFGGNVSNWLFTPVLSLNTGNMLTFFTRTEPGGSAFGDILEVRLSENGSSTNVGSSDSSVGDFTILLLNLNSGLPEDWTQFAVSLNTGDSATSGRIAFRYIVNDTSVNGDYIGIDTVVQTPEPMSAIYLVSGLAGLALHRRKRRS